MEVLRSLFAKTTVALKLEDPLTVGVIVWYFYITTACFYRQDLRMCARPRSANRVNFEENIHCKKKTIRVSPVVFSIFASTTWQETVHNVRNLSYTQMRTVKRIFYQVQLAMDTLPKLMHLNYAHMCAFVCGRPRTSLANLRDVWFRRPSGNFTWLASRFLTKASEGLMRFVRCSSRLRPSWIV